MSGFVLGIGVSLDVEVRFRSESGTHSRTFSEKVCTHAATIWFGRQVEMAKSKTADYGPYHVAGNAWEWCSDWYRALYTQLADAMRYSQQPAEDPTLSLIHI